MKKIIVGMVLLLFSLFTIAETIIVSEILIGQSQHKISTYEQYEKFDPYENYLGPINDNSLGIRLGVKIIDNIYVELAMHDHGSVNNEFTITKPNLLFSGNCCLSSSQYDVEERSIPNSIESIRLGIKAKYMYLQTFRLMLG